MLGPVTCAACGAKVREDRARCLRCGEPLRRSGGSGAQPPPAQRISTPRLSMIAGIVALGGVAALMVARPAPDVSASAAGEPAVSVAPAAATGDARAPGVAPGELTAAPVFSSMDVSRQGLAAYNRGDIAGSLEQFQTAVDADPANPDALNNLGQVLVRSGRPRDAIPYFDRAIEISSGVWAYQFNRARAFAQLEQWTLAVAGYREAARLFPDDYVTQFNLARALEADGDIEGAVSGYERAIALAPGEPDFHLSHAHALELAGRPADAAAAYRRFLDLQETAPQADKIKARIAEIEGGPGANVPAP